MKDLYGMTVKELDEILEAMDLPKDGLKADKIERLEDVIFAETSETGEKPEVKDYDIVMWAGRIPVYVCAHCGRQYDDRDRCIMHILGHYPKDEQESVLERLVKDKENGK